MSDRSDYFNKRKLGTWLTVSPRVPLFDLICDVCNVTFAREVQSIFISDEVQKHIDDLAHELRVQEP